MKIKIGKSYEDQRRGRLVCPAGTIDTPSQTTLCWLNKAHTHRYVRMVEVAVAESNMLLSFYSLQSS